MTNSEGFSSDEAIFPREYFVYCKEKWRTAGGKDPLLGHVDGFRRDPRVRQDWAGSPEMGEPAEHVRVKLPSDFLSADEHPLPGVIRVGDDEVRQLAGFDGADLVRRADGLGGVEGRRTDGRLLGDVPL